MKNADKDRDPDKARKRARSDARCALRKLGLLDWLLTLDPQSTAGPQWLAKAKRELT